MNITTKRLRLYEVALNDIEMIHRLHLFAEVDEFNTLGIPGSIDQTQTLVEEWVAKQKTSPRIAYIFSVRLIDTNEFVGLIALNVGKPNYKSAEVWYKFDPAYWKRGYATECLKALIEVGFKDLSLHRIEAGCATGNIGSIKVLEKAGMTREGCKRKILPIRGEWVDNYFYAILDTDI